jgi:hypothetical protein
MRQVGYNDRAVDWDYWTAYVDKMKFWMRHPINWITDRVRRINL